MRPSAWPQRSTNLGKRAAMFLEVARLVAHAVDRRDRVAADGAEFRADPPHVAVERALGDEAFSMTEDFEKDSLGAVLQGLLRVYLPMFIEYDLTELRRVRDNDPALLAANIQASTYLSTADVIVIQEIRRYTSEPESRAQHLAEILGWVEGVLTAPSWDIAPIGGEPYQAPKLTSRQGILDLFDRNVAAARKAIAVILARSPSPT